MYCRKCGNLLQPGDIFCNKCGEKVVTEKSQTNAREFNPMFKQETQVASTPKIERVKERQTAYREEFDWNLDGYPKEETKKTEEIDFNWESVLDERDRRFSELQKEKARELERENQIDLNADFELSDSDSTDMFDWTKKPFEEPTIEKAEPKVEEPLEFAEDTEIIEPIKEEVKTVEEEIEEFEPVSNLNDLLGDSAEIEDVDKTTRIDKFYTFNKKNAEFQALLDQEYAKLKTNDDNLEVESESKEEKPIIEEVPIEEIPVEKIPLEEAPKVEIPTEEAFQEEINEYMAVSQPTTPKTVSAFADLTELNENIDNTEEADKDEETEEKKFSFDDIFDDDDEEDEQSKGHGFLKFIAVILCILIALELFAIGMKAFARDSGVTKQIDKVIDSISDLFSANGVENQEDSGIITGEIKTADSGDYILYAAANGADS